MKDINHIVYLMLENRSLDNALGWLYENDSPAHFIPAYNKEPYNGLNPGLYNPDEKGGKVYVSKITPAQGQTIPSVDPHEEFEHVQKQMANNMQGFYIDFLTAGSKKPAEIMQCYTPASLPVLNSLAKQFAVSDAYYSSIPTQTNCNRAFSLTGNSIGQYHYLGNKRTAMVNNYWEKGPADLGDPYVFTEKSIWNVLCENGFSKETDWMVFYSQTWPGVAPYKGKYCFTQDLLWPNMNILTSKFRGMTEFFDRAANGSLPLFSYLEPSWYEIVHNGNDYHPPANTGCGEMFLYQLYQKLQASPKWNETLLIINFDEHGGTYDHVTPPGKVPEPWQRIQDGTKPPDDFDIKFSFTSLGVRVPLVLVSPLIQGGTLLRPDISPYFDHTSVIATILERFGIPKSKWGLGSRTNQAATFEKVITLSKEQARSKVAITPPLNNQCTSGENAAPGHLQYMILHRMLSRMRRQAGFGAQQFHELYQQHFAGAGTMQEMNAAADKILNKMFAAGTA